MIATAYWQDLTTTDLVGLDPENTVVILPVSAIEQHGPHLPLATDAMIGDGLVRLAMERVRQGVLVLPAMPIAIGRAHV